jgi:hypothetical protein
MIEFHNKTIRQALLSSSIITKEAEAHSGWKEQAQGHPVCKWHSWDLNLYLSNSSSAHYTAKSNMRGKEEMM